MSRAELEIEGADLQPGDSLRIVCPSCGGGNSREKSLVMTRNDEGVLLFLCWRASCDARGVVGGSPSRIAGLAVPRNRVYKVKPDPSGRFYHLDDEQAWSFVSPAALIEFGVRYDPETNRMAFPVYGPTGLVRGWVLRALYSDQFPKVLSVPTSAEPQLGWNLVEGTSVVVVEDIPSAIRLREFGVRAVSVLGTHLTDEAADELITEAEQVVFALDRDAFKKSVALNEKLRIHFRDTAVLLLPKDFKDQQEEEVKECLRQVQWLKWSPSECAESAGGVPSFSGGV